MYVFITNKELILRFCLLDTYHKCWS